MITKITFGIGSFVVTIFLIDKFNNPFMIIFNNRMDGKDDCKAESVVFVMNLDRNCVPRMILHFDIK